MEERKQENLADPLLYQRLYLHLFNAVTDAVGALDRGWPEAARALLIRAQQDCEEQYIAG